MAELGASVGILDFDGEGGEQVASEVNGYAVQVDVSDEAAVDVALGDIESKLVAVRVAVSCAGVGQSARIVGREGKTSSDVFQLSCQ